MKTLSVTIICKNEESNLSRLLPQLNFANQIVVVDTGSSDNSVNVAKRYTSNVFFYKWRDDFSAARNYAISKASCDYILWLDADDDVSDVTANAIKNWLQSDKENQDVVYLKYRMGASGSVWFWRERIIKRVKQCRFKGFIHEAISPFGETKYLDCEVVHISNGDHSERNLAIYRNAIKNGKRFSLRDKYYFARTLTENDLFEEAEIILKKFCANKKGYVVDRVQGYKILVRQALKQNEKHRALIYLSKSVEILPPDNETCCLFGDVYYVNGNYLYAACWYEYALYCKMQSGFINDYYKNFYPKIQLSVCWWRLGDVRQAKFYHKAAQLLDPLNPVILNNDKWFS